VRLTVRLFGSASFAVDGAPWPFSAPPGCLPLVAYLALRTEPVPRAAVAVALWPDVPEADARANLRRHVHRLKRALPDLGAESITDDARGLAWNHDGASVDVARFLQAIDDPQRLAEAADAYRGDLLAGCEDEWLVVERERLRTLYLAALNELCATAGRRRDFAVAAGYAERLLALDDLRDDAVRHLMGARYESGDRSAALATYDRFAARLRAELDVEPMSETIALRDAIVAGLPLHDPGVPPPAGDALVRDTRGMPFVGRSGELDALTRAWMRAAHGLGSTMLVVGEAGLGKSRLAAEFSSVVERQGGHVLVGLTAQPESAPYQPLIAAAQRGLPALGRNGLDDVWATALTGVLPEIRAIRPELGNAEVLDAARARIRLHEALARYFEALARNRPLVLILEDLHWAGRDTIDAIEALARRSAGAPLLIVATFRPEDGVPANGMRALARRLQSELRATRTMLAPLRPEEIDDLIASSPAFGQAPAELSSAVARLSEGNPLFAWQLLRGYEETRRIPDSDDAVRNVSDAILARVERLAPDVRSVAEAAATVGQSFTVDMVGVAGGWGEAFVHDALDELLLRRLVYASTGDGETYAFSHALIASAIYAASAAEVRRPRHRRIARMLERSADAERAFLGVRARHYDLAGDSVRAYASYLAAAGAALGVFARDEATSYARRAAELAAGDEQTYAALVLSLRALDPGVDLERRKADLALLDDVVTRLGDDERFVALEERAAYLARAADAPAAHATTIEAMFAMARAADDSERLMRVLDAQAYCMIVSGNIGAAEAPLAEALALAQRCGDTAREASLSLKLAGVQIRLAKGAGALDVIRRRHAALTPSSSPAEWLDVLNAEINCVLVLEEMVLGARSGAELLTLAQRVGDVESEARAHGALSYVAHWNTDAAGMREHSDLALEAFERLGQRHALAVTLFNRGTQEFELGQIDDALRFWERSGAIAERIGLHEGVALAELSRAEAELVRERFDLAAPIAARALESARPTGEERHVVEALVILGAAKGALGEHAAGLRDLREGIARRRAAGGARSLPHELAYLVEALVRADQLAAAAEAAEELAALDSRTAKHPARVQAVLAAFRSATGDGAAAQRHRDAGRRLLRDRLASLGPSDARAYRALPFARALLSRSPAHGAGAPR